jgi:Acetyltransferase (GNAT) domain
MFVSGDWTRRGLGRAILDACERAARAEGFRSLVLMATLPGEPLYRAFGFREVERVLLRMPDGVSMERGRHGASRQPLLVSILRGNPSWDGRGPARSFPQSFHLGPLRTTGWAQSDDAPDLTCEDGTAPYPMDGGEATHNR